MKQQKHRLVLLDTHAILHRAYHALPDFSSSKGEPTGALYGLISMLVKIIGELEPDYIVAAFDLPGPTFRHTAFKEYKAQRKEADDALVSQLIRSRDVLDALGVARYEHEGYEADDVIGTIVEEMKKHPEVEVIIASGDMDTLQLVDDRVKAYTLRKGLTDTILYDAEKVKIRYGFGPEHIPDFKGLRGDPSDNIPGVRGVGEKTATALISAFGSLEDVYKALKSDPAKLAEEGVKGGMLEKLKEQEEQAFFSKELAIIRRDAPINFALPPMWRESVEVKKVLDMIAQFEFRSLIPRLKTVLGAAAATLEERKAGVDEPGPFYHEDLESSLFDAQPLEEVEAEEFWKLALAAWVIDSNITQPTLDDVYRVGRAEKFAEAKEYILKDIQEKNLSFVYEDIELKLAPVLRKMEETGIMIDPKFFKELSKTYAKELDKIAKRIYDAAGGEFNINSPKQLGEILFDKLGLGVKNQKKTATGARSTRESELEKLKDQHPVVADVLAYRELSKLLSTYIDVIPTLADGDDRVHTTYVQTGSATGRLASQNPNLQNIPIKTELGRAIRHGFVAGKGFELVSFDYSQIELRVAALLSSDPALVETFRAGRDIHTEVASRVFHVEGSDVTYEMRRRAKVINFGILYGMGVNALREALGTSRSEAQDFYNEYFAAFPRLAIYLDETKADAARLGYTETLFGRRRYFDGIKSPIPYVRASAERMAINAPIQGTSADLIKLAMVEISAWIEKEKLGGDVRMLLQVHDELVFEIHPKKTKTCAKKIKEIMESVVPEDKRHDVPLIVEGKVGKNWGDMEELKI
jgi:DNA polymerase-1